MKTLSNTLFFLVSGSIMLLLSAETRSATATYATSSLEGDMLHAADSMKIVDTARFKKNIERSDEFYNKLEAETKNSRLTRFAFKTFVTGDGRDSVVAAGPKLINENEYFDRFEGKTIDSIIIYRNNIFEKSASGRSLGDWANRVHIISREKNIRQMLLFKEEGVVDANNMVKTEQLLREQNYLSDAEIMINDKGDGKVDVIVITRDKWTVGAGFESVGEGHYYLNIYDNNFLGYGNRFGIRTYTSFSDGIYGGNMVEYGISNLRGTFFDADFYAGTGFDDERYGASLSKEFILPSDYTAGVVAELVQGHEMIYISDTMEVVENTNIDLWFGKSFKVEPLGGNIYAIGRFRDMNYDRRPPGVRADSNTVFHSYSAVLLSTGIYRESFYRGSMIHGLGSVEDIPYGYRFEITGGKYWSEYGDKYYASASFSRGRQHSFGYLSGAVTASSFFNSGGAVQSSLDVDIGYFSNLFTAGRSSVRQFANIGFVRGYNRLNGEGERLVFHDRKAPRGIGPEEKAQGNSRLVLNTETVVFSPLYFYGFRFAFFGFWDSAWIGDESVVFKNDYYTTIGVGVRIKNERLIFKAIQLRLGIALNKNGLVDYNIFNLSSEGKLNADGFKPTPPSPYLFR